MLVPIQCSAVIGFPRHRWSCRNAAGFPPSCLDTRAPLLRLPSFETARISFGVLQGSGPGPVHLDRVLKLLRLGSIDSIVSPRFDQSRILDLTCDLHENRLSPMA